MSIFSALDQALSLYQEKYPEVDLDAAIGTIDGIWTAVKNGQEVATTPDNKDVMDEIVAIIRAA